MYERQLQRPSPPVGAVDEADTSPIRSRNARHRQPHRTSPRRGGSRRRAWRRPARRRRRARVCVAAARRGSPASVLRRASETPIPHASARPWCRRERDHARDTRAANSKRRNTTGVAPTVTSCAAVSIRKSPYSITPSSSARSRRESACKRARSSGYAKGARNTSSAPPRTRAARRRGRRSGSSRAPAGPA